MQKNELIDLYNERGRKLKKNRGNFYAKYRKLLLSQAQGRTLEVAVGAGANFSFYPLAVELTGVDFSPVLLNLAAESARKNHLNAHFIQSDVESLAFEENSFDTIVSTLSLCVYSNPVQVLKKFNQWCKPEGKILLLEHGLGSNPALNWLLNQADNWCFRKNGDHLNLDVKRAILQSGLIVETMQTAIWGTHYLIKARPFKRDKGTADCVKIHKISLRKSQS